MHGISCCREIGEQFGKFGERDVSGRADASSALSVMEQPLR